MDEPNIALKDRTGNSGTYEGIDMIKIPGHNADGSAEEIIFKKYLAGVSDGKLRMTSGTFDIPGKLYLDTGIPNENEWKTDKNGHWTMTRTDIPAPDVALGKSIEYKYECYGAGDVQAFHHEDFYGYGECIAIGNSGFFNGDFKYTLNPDELFLVLYNVNTRQTTITIAKSPCVEEIEESGKYKDQIFTRLKLRAPVGGDSFRKVSFNHGGQQKPDAVFMFVANYPGYNKGFHTTAAWGLKSSLRGLTSDNSVSGMTETVNGYTNQEFALDIESNASNRKHWLSCPDDTSVEISGDFVLNGQYRWFAIWGLTDETT